MRRNGWSVALPWAFPWPPTVICLVAAIDVLPIGQALGYQAMEVGEDGAVSTVDNALSMASAYGLTQGAALGEARSVAGVVDGWRKHFLAAGVPDGVVDSLAMQIDRPALREQRAQLG